jgi:hypothetical protein
MKKDSRAGRAKGAVKRPMGRELDKGGSCEDLSSRKA